MTDYATFARIVRRVDPGAALLRVRSLTGGISAQVTALDITRADGRAETLVARQHGAVDLANNPRVASMEYDLLTRLAAHGIAAPRPYFADESGELLPSPYLVLSYIDGSPDAYPSDHAAFARQVAAALQAIHAVDAAEVAFLPRAADRIARKLATPPARLDAELREAEVRRWLAAHPPAGRNAPCLAHGDFWTGNLLWQDGRLAGIVDWENGEIADPLADIANARLELLWKFGADMLTAFTDACRADAALDFTDLPYWDLVAALRAAGKLGQWGLDPSLQQRMTEQTRWFIAQAIAGLTSN